MSLPLRLSLIITLLFFAGMALGVLVLVNSAKQRVAAEVQSTANLTTRLLELTIAGTETPWSEEKLAALVEQVRQVKGVRHLQLVFSSSDHTVNLSAEPAAEVSAPAWFVRMVKPELPELERPLAGNIEGEIVIRTNPADEIEESWQETKVLLTLLAAVLLAVNGILFLIVARWLKPVREIVSALEEVERGDFSRRIPSLILPELKLIAEKLNNLSEVLSVSQEENDRLTRQSLFIQEQERRYLAQELHDEMGQSISAIKAIAVSISRRSGAQDGLSGEYARNIEEISNHVYERVRGMMGRLRPHILDELGLVSALQQMVDDWNAHHSEIFCDLRIEESAPGLNESQQIHVYRIVQEALTNVVKHSQAEKVKVRLYWRNNKTVCHLSIEDDGAGYDPDSLEKNMGLMGMEDRVKALHGGMDLASAPGKGMKINIEFPVGQP